jgi:uncharacterized membrane protein YhaH (DUF805 family)
MTFVGAIKSVFKQFAVFTGTAKRSEYWYFILFSFLIGIVVATLDPIIFPQEPTDDPLDSLNQLTPLSNITSLILLIPNLAVTSRRIRDAGWSGKWLLLYMLPIGSLVISLFALIAYTQGPDYGSTESLITALSFLVPTLLLAFGVAIFLFILSVLPSKSREQGNKYASEV